MASIDTVVQKLEPQFTDPQEAIAAFRKIRIFFPRDNYLYDSVVRIVRQRGETVTKKSVYRSLAGERRKIRESMQSAVFDLAEQIDSKHIRDRNILPVKRYGAMGRLRKIQPLAKKLRHIYQFTSYRTMARHICEQVSAEDMPISTEFILYLLVGRVPDYPLPEAYRVYLELSRMEMDAKKKRLDTINPAYVVKNKKGGPSEPLEVFVRRALKYFLGSASYDNRKFVEGALKEFKSGQLAPTVRKVAKDYGFESVPTTYEFLFDFADIKLRRRQHIKIPENVRAKLYALAGIMRRAKERQLKPYIDPSYLVVAYGEYIKPINNLVGRGFRGGLLAALLSYALNTSTKRARAYINGEIGDISATKHKVIEALEERLRTASLVDISNPRKDGEAYERFKSKYQSGPVIVITGQRKKLPTKTLKDIRDIVSRDTRHPYSYPRAIGKGYLPFSYFLKLMPTINPPH